MRGEKENDPRIEDLNQVDESTLSWQDRLGLAYCRLNCWQWDELLGPKPEGFDALPNSRTGRGRSRKSEPCKSDYILPATAVIRGIIGRVNISRCWWKFVLKKSDEEWLAFLIKARLLVEECQSAN